jgi:transcription-repair coupling factor (superfamily II helicase)
LEAVRDYAEFGAGFKIAMRDLELRGAGDLLGAQQHGHLDAVGYDLYIKLLSEAVLEERGIAKKEEQDCKVTLDFDAYLPDSYVRFPSQRMALYKRIALIRNIDDYYDIVDELVDRYGELPKPAKNLCTIALIRGNAMACGIEALEQEGGSVKIFPSHINIDVWSELSDAFDGSLKIVMASKTYINLYLRKAQHPLELINKIFEKYIQIANENK